MHSKAVQNKDFMERLKKAQRDLSKKVIKEDRFSSLDKVAGFDVAYKGDKAFAGASLYEINPLKEMEEFSKKREVNFPYISGLFYLRELRPILDLYKGMEEKPDVLMMNAKGIEHPRHFGLASHIGLILDKPSLGVTNSLLCGKIDQEPVKKGETVFIYNEVGKRLGAALKSEEGSNPIYISQGHKISLETSIDLVKNSIGCHKLPEPLRIADKVSKNFK